MKEINYLDNLVGCFGQPVADNPGVVIQDAAFADMGLERWHFLTLDVDKDKLEDAFKGLKAFKMHGINCTVPHKIECMKYLDEVSPAAKMIGAVNMIVNRDGYLYGENTDGKGFMESLESNGIDVRGKNLTVFGAGGAARAICVESGLAGAKHINIISRPGNKARDELVELITKNTAAAVDTIDWVGTAKVPADTDIVAQATSVGMYPNIDAMPDIDLDTITPDMFVQDVIMNPPESALVRELKKRGIRCAGGAVMMIGQAAINVEMWTGRKPNKQVMMDAYLKALT